MAIRPNKRAMIPLKASAHQLVVAFEVMIIFIYKRINLHKYNGS
jgi:hypothetical protein